MSSSRFSVVRERILRTLFEGFTRRTRVRTGVGDDGDRLIKGGSLVTLRSFYIYDRPVRIRVLRGYKSVFKILFWVREMVPDV